MTNGNNPSKSELKKMRSAGALRKKKAQKIVWLGSGLVAIALLAGWFIWNGSARIRNIPGEFIPDQGRRHVTDIHDHEPYNSNPPTSGPHWGQPANWGAYKEELPDEVLIHNLEHGGVWISYRPDVPNDVIAKLEGFYDKYGRKIIVTPRSANDADIALAAWTRLDKFSVSDYSDERVEEFIRAYRNRGPEFVP